MREGCTTLDAAGCMEMCVCDKGDFGMVWKRRLDKSSMDGERGGM
jgi:hypothetical protein